MTKTPEMTKEQEDAFVRDILKKRAEEKVEAQKAANAEELKRYEAAIPALVEGKAVKVDALLDALESLDAGGNNAVALNARLAGQALGRLQEHLTRTVDALKADVVVPPTVDLIVEA